MAPFVLYRIVLHCTVFCIVLYCIVLYRFVLYCTVLYSIVLYCIELYCIVLYCTVLYSTVLFCIVLYCIVLYCAVLYCAVLFCISSFLISFSSHSIFLTITPIFILSLWRFNHYFRISAMFLQINGNSNEYEEGTLDCSILESAVSFVIAMYHISYIFFFILYHNDLYFWLLKIFFLSCQIFFLFNYSF